MRLKERFHPVTDCLGFHCGVGGKRTSSVEETMLLWHGVSEKMGRCTATCWLTQDQVTDVTCRRILATLDDLEHRGDGDVTDRDASGAKRFGINVGEAVITAKGMHAVMCTTECLNFLELARDVHPVLLRHSKKWQANDIDLTEVRADVDALVEELQGIVDTPGEHCSSRLDFIAGIEKALDIEINFGHP